jgi:hypothetical protein
MRPFWLLVIFILSPGAHALEPDETAQVEQAKQAIAAYGAALKLELTTAMQSGGPVAAIEVCRKKAPAIASAVSLERGLQISRTSLRNRSPENSPSSWQVEVLELFEARKRSGEEPATLDWTEVTRVNGSSEFRYMKAIPTQGLCLQCHGESLAASVSEKLAELYPHDQATGFKAGDLRGAFVVTKKL